MVIKKIDERCIKMVNPRFNQNSLLSNIIYCYYDKCNIRDFY